MQPIRQSTDIPSHHLPEPAMLLDSTVLDARLALRHAVSEVALHWLRELLQVAVAESVLLLARIICCPYDLFNLLCYYSSKLICCRKNDNACHAKNAQGQKHAPWTMTER